MLTLFFFRVAQHAKQSDDDIEARYPPDAATGMAVVPRWARIVDCIIANTGLGRLHIATELGVSELVIGLTIVAVGTSLPELAASVMSALKVTPIWRWAPLSAQTCSIFCWC